MEALLFIGVPEMGWIEFPLFLGLLLSISGVRVTHACMQKVSIVSSQRSLPIK